MRKCNVFLVCMVIAFVGVALMVLHSTVLEASEEVGRDARREWVAKLGLSDLCLFTDARYTRHPVMADVHTPFQDYPLAFEHFPSGSIIGAPPHLRGERSW